MLNSYKNSGTYNNQYVVDTKRFTGQNHPSTILRNIFPLSCSHRYKNSGTYNNQYMVVDTKRFEPLQRLAPGLLWVAEQVGSGNTTKQTKFINK